MSAARQAKAGSEAAGDGGRSLAEWRRVTLWRILLVAQIMLLPIIVFNIYRAIARGWLGLVGVEVAVMLALGLLCLPQLSHRLRLAGLLAIGGGYALLAFYGALLVGSGRVVLFAMVIIAAIFLEWRLALAYWLGLALAQLGISWAVAAGALRPLTATATLADDPNTLISNGLTLVMLSGLASITLLALSSRLRASLEAAEAARAELEQRVAERTARLEAALAENRDLMASVQLILRTIPEHFWLKDTQGRYRLVSDAMADYHGLRAEEIVGRRAEEIYDQSLTGYIEQSDREVIVGSHSVTSEHQHTRPDGRVEWFESSVTPLYDEAGALTGLFGLSRNATARKRMEASLARQLRYTAALAECAQTLLVGEDDLARSLSEAINALRAALEVGRIYLYHYGDAPELGVRRSLELVAEATDPDVPVPLPLDQATIADIPTALVEALEGGRAFGGPSDEVAADNQRYRQYLADNQICSLLLVPVPGTGGPWGHLGVNDYRRARRWDDEDIRLMSTATKMVTAFLMRQQARAALAERERQLQAAIQTTRAGEARLRALRDAIPDLIFVIDQQHIYRDFHAPQPDLLFTPPERFLGRQVTEVLPAAQSAQVIGAIEQMRREGGVVLFEYELELADGAHSFEARVAAIDAELAMVLIRDISEQHRAAAALLQAKDAAEAADRAKSAFLAHMSHEIRTPLNAVIGSAELLAEASLSPEHQEFVETIIVGGNTLLAIVNDVLDLARIESGRLDLAAEPFSLRACLGASLALTSYAAQRKGLALREEIGPECPDWLIGDEVRLRQVLVNLLANAVKFTDVGGVTVRVAVASGAQAPAARCPLVIEVSDTGSGIAADQIEHIFSPFIQADGSPTRRHGGTGLGLAISRQLVDLMGGRLSVTSELGRGSTFRVELALARAPEQPAPAEGGSGEGPAVPGLRILVAEDNQINQLVLRRLLARLGLAADVAGDGAAALAAVRSRPYDLVLMDLQMPALDGLEATAAIRAAGQRLHQPVIIALTASPLAGDRERLRQAGLDGYLSKPVHLDDLRRILGQVGLAAPALPAAGPGPIDRRVLEDLERSLGSDGATVIAEIIRLFTDDYQRQFGLLSELLRADDREGLRKLAHLLRGGSRQIGAVALAELLSAIEREASTLDPAALAELVGRAEAAYAMARARLLGEPAA